MNKTRWRITLLFLICLAVSTSLIAGDTPCTATPLPNNMTTFQTYNNTSNGDSGVPAPDCGNYVTADIWFSVVVPPSGMLDIVTLAGTNGDGAMAIYDGTCSNLNLLACTEDDNCGNTIMPIMNLTNLIPGTTIYIRVWAEGGGPNGNFQIRVSEGPVTAQPVPTTSTVGNANLNGDCVQLTTASAGQTGCAWDPNQIDLNNPFDETFVFNFGSDDGGADGICWVFQNNPSGLSTCGTTGQNIAANFGNSFIIEFDTYDNGAVFSDIPNDHVSVNINGAMDAAINGPINLGNIEDGLDHEIRFVWNPTTNGYEVYFDGALSISGNYDIINNCLGGNSTCYWGFTASTGGAVNNQSVCPPPVEEYPAGDQSTVEVEICEGESYFAGGANQTTSGFYTDITPLPNGCNSILNTNLIVNPAGYYSYDAAVCFGECEFVGNQPLCNTGVFDVTLPGQAWNGCDSIVTVNLTVLNPVAVAFPPAPLTCFNTSTLIDASPSTTGPGTVTYTWTGPTPGCILSGENTLTPVVNCEGTYTMTLVQILNGTVCTTMTMVDVISAAILPTVEAGDNQSFDCSNNCVTLSSAGSDSGPNYSLTWTGPGSFSSNDPNPEVCVPGVYTLSILNTATGCLASDVVFVSGDSNPPNIAATVSGLLTCDDIMVTLDGSGSNGTGNLSFEWFDDDNISLGMTAQVDVTTAGTYSLVITDEDNGCIADTMIVVAENANEPTALASASDELDCSDNPITISGDGSLGLGTLSYEWQNIDGDSLGEGLTYETDQAGSYILIITDSDNGCTASTSVNVMENISIPTIDATVSGPLTCMNLNTILDGTNSSGLGTISYEWLDSEGSLIGDLATVNVDSAGTYSLIITDDSNECTASTTIDVLENIEAPNPDISSDGILTCIDLEVELDASGSTGIGIISYEWFDIDGTSLGTDEILDVNTTDTYSVIITDGENGCTAEASFSPEEDIETPNPSATADDLLTCSEMEVSLDGSASNGAGVISYEWFDMDGNSIGTDEVLEVEDTESYTLVITDSANGCMADTTINAMENIVPPNADAGDDASITCADSETTLDGENSSSGPDYSYEWINEGGVTVGTDISVEVMETGIYTLVVTNDTNGCTATSMVEVNPDANLPTADAGEGATLTCDIDQVSLDGNDSSSGSNISYVWLNPDGDSLSNELNIDVATIGTYTLVVTNTDNGCSATSSVEVDENTNQPMADAGPNAFLTCTETEVILSGSNSSGGDLTYEWFDESGTSISQEVEVTVDQTEDYTLVVTDLENGCTGSTTISVLPDADVPTADAGQNSTLTCSNTEAILNGINSSAGSNFEYQWQDANGVLVGDSINQIVSNTGTYTLIVTNTDNGCTAISTVEILENVDPPNAIAGADTTLTCAHDELILNANQSSVPSGVITNYEWYDEDGNLLSNLAIADVAEAGIYSLVITGSNGCTASDNLEVDEDFQAPIANPETTGLLTCIDTSVTLDGSSSTGTGSLAYEWLDENDLSLGNDPMIDVDSIGIYTLMVTDLVNGCTQSEAINVSQNIASPNSNAGQEAFLTCEDTEVTLVGSGTSQSGMTAYDWQNENNVSVGDMPSVMVSETGTYTLIITDELNGCTTSSTVDVLPDANLPTANAGASFTLTCSETEVVLDGSNSSVGSNIEYVWQDQDGVLLGDELSQSVDQIGIYTLIVSDTDNGCSATSTVEIFENVEPPVANAGVDPTLTCDNNQITLDAGMSSSTSGAIILYEWFDSNNVLISDEENAIVTEAGIYNLVVTGSNGCTDSDEVEVLLDANIPEAIIGAGGLLTCETTNIELGDSNSNGGLNVSYEWTDSDGNILGINATIQISDPNTYTLLVTNLDNDCEATSSLEILQDITPPIADAGINETLTCVLTDYEIGGSATSTGTAYSYEWQDENAVIIANTINTEVSIPGVYTLLVTNNSNACTANSEVIIDQDIQNPNADAGDDGILTCDVSEVSLDGSNSTGSSLSYEWLNESDVVISNMPVTPVSETGIFTLVVTNNENGCTAESMVTVIPDANLPTALADPDGVLTCIVDQINIDGSASTSMSGMTNFEWQDDLGNTLSIADNFDTNAPGIYTLIVTDEANGCSTTTNVEVLEDILQPTADAGSSQTLICGQTEATLTGLGGNGTNLSYEWQDDLGNPIGNLPSVSVAAVGTYTLIVTNEDNGCSASSTVDLVPDTNLPTADAGTSGTLNCETTVFTLNGNGSSLGIDFEYEWQDQLGNVLSNDLMFDVIDPGTYTLWVLNTSNNCSAQDQVTINQDIDDPIAFADFVAAQAIDCNNSSITLDGSGSSPFGSLTFQWSTTNGNILSGANTINPEINEPGTYDLIVTNTDNGCTSTTSIPVEENISEPFIIIENPDLINCLIEEVNIDASGSSTIGDYTYVWTGTGLIAGANTLEPTVNQSGIFTLTIIDNENGCQTQESITVNENTVLPTVANIALGEFDCLTESVGLSGEGSSVGSDFSYLWTGNGTIDNPNTLFPTVYQTGAYTLMVTDASNGCTITETVVVSEDTNVPTDFDLILENPKCFGEDGTVIISEVIGGDAPYLYSIDGGETFIAQNIFTHLEPGNYDLVVQDANGCEYADDLLITTPIEVNVDLEPSVIIPLGTDYQLNPLINIPIDEIDTIIWSPAEGLSCADCLTPEVIDLFIERIYTVTVINENGCSDTDEIILRVKKDRDVYIPNAFSPDNDGINDVLMIFAGGDEIKEVTTFQIFDRWGELVYEANNFQPNDPAFGWNGKLNDEQLNPGVFVYWTRVEFIDGASLIFKGDVTMVK